MQTSVKLQEQIAQFIKDQQHTQARPYGSLSEPWLPVEVTSYPHLWGEEPVTFVDFEALKLDTMV